MTVVVFDANFILDDVVKELGVFNGGLVHGFSFKPPRFMDNFVDEGNLLDWNSGKYNYSSISDIVTSFFKDSAEYFAMGDYQCDLFSRMFNVHFINLEVYGCEEMEPKSWLSCSSYPVRHKFINQCAEKRVETYGNWLMELFNNKSTIV